MLDVLNNKQESTIPSELSEGHQDLIDGVLVARLYNGTHMIQDSDRVRERSEDKCTSHTLVDVLIFPWDSKIHPW